MKLRNLMGAFLALAGLTFAGGAFAGDVWEFRWDSQTNVSYAAGESVRFRMRLLSADWENAVKTSTSATPFVKVADLDNATVAAYYLSDPVHAAENLNADFPLQIGVVANGQTRGAKLVDYAVTNQAFGADFVFEYVVQTGDYALPLRLAADANGTPINSGANASKYFFFNGPNSGNAIWKIVSGETEFSPQMVDQDTSNRAASTKKLEARQIQPYDVQGDYLRAHFGFRLETLQLDDQTATGDDGNDYWRVVRGSKSRPDAPRIETVDGLLPPERSETVKVYAWIAPAGGRDDDFSTWGVWTENDYAVTIPSGANVQTMKFEDPDGTARDHNVYVFTLAAGTPTYSFTLKGQHVDGTARVIFSSSPHWNKIGSTGDWIATDYRAKTVFCGKQQPTISVSLDGYSSVARFPNGDHTLDNYEKGERLRVRLEGVDSHPEFTARLSFELGDAEVGFPTNIIAISTDPVAGFRKNPLPDMTVHFAADADEATESDDDHGLYLFILGATKETAIAPGITITPKIEGADVAVNATNSQYVVIGGMKPEIISPRGTQENPAPAVTVSCGMKQRFAISINDSYRNLYLLENGTNGHYTVTWNRGIGSELTITNSFDGGPLVPDANGILTVGVTYPQSTATNEYVSVFTVRNPEGLVSVENYLTVRTKDPPVVTAETSDGAIQVIESDVESQYVNIRFRLLPDASESVDFDNLHVFLEPANEAASNRTDAAFLTVRKDATKTHGVKLFEGKAYTGNDDPEIQSGYEYGGLHILDGDDKATARYNVVLCNSEEYDSTKRVDLYASKTFSINLMNFAPAVDAANGRFKIAATGDSGSKSYYGYHSETTAAIRTGHTISMRVDNPVTDWNDDVSADLFATNEDQVVLRWLVYEVDANGLTRDPYDFFWTVGTNSVYELADGFDEPGIKKVVVQVQDKDMRDSRCVVKEGGKWIYHMDPEDPDYDEWKKDRNKWGDEFVFYLNISDQPTIDLTPVGSPAEFRNKPEFSESQVYPFPLYNGIDKDYVLENGNVGFKMRLSAPYDTRSTLTFRAWVEGEGKTNDVTLAAETVKGFRNNTETTATVDIPLSAFDGIYSEPGIPYKYTLKVQLVKAGTDESAAVSNHYVVGTCDFYVRNEAPLVMLTDRKQQEASVAGETNSAVKCVKNEVMTIPWRIEDVVSDKTNQLRVVCTTSSGGSVSDPSSTNLVGVTGTVSGSFSVSFSSAGEQWALIEVTDKDGDVGEARVYFLVEANKNALIYPARPFNSALGSDLIGDYLPKAGYGCTWANGKLGGVENFMQTWTYGVGSASAIAYARGYVAGEQETSESRAFVDANGSWDGKTSPTGLTGFSPSQHESEMATLDSFFYRWFVKSASGKDDGGGEWAAAAPDPQVSTNESQRVKQLTIDLPLEQKDNVFSDVSAYALFSREYLWSDNLGDINLDGVPDIHVVSLKLTGGDYAEGKDLNDVNYSEDGKTPFCQDYLPITELLSYSKLIPGITSYDNIKDAVAFTPRKKLRGAAELGASEALNDATAKYLPNNDGTQTVNGLFVAGAQPEKVYELEDGSYDAEKCTISWLEYLAWSEFKAAHQDATFDSWSPERPTDPKKADTDNDGITDGYEYFFWYRAHVGWIDANGVHRYLTGRRYNPRNPGEGDLISSEEIERIFDPLVPTASKTQDTDNDGLPDLLEFEIGTNPFDFDTDGDGLPDGFEVCNVGNLDPLDPASHLDGKSDTERNSDGDAMAITSYALEKQQKPVPAEIEHAKLTTFALIDPDGDTDGVQWYATRMSPEEVLGKMTATTNAASVWSFESEGRAFVSTVRPLLTADGRLGNALAKGVAFVATKPEQVVTNGTIQVEDQENPGTTNDVDVLITNYVAAARYPVRIEAGMSITKLSADPIDGVVTTLAAEIKEDDANACWIYGRGTVTNVFGDVAKTAAEYGCLALGRYKGAKKGAVVCALPSDERDVAFLHYLVYQEFGFDPRTAWKAKDPLATRWGNAIDGQAVEGITVIQQGGYTGAPSRTRDYANYDEFLVYSFFLNNGCDMKGVTRIIDSDARAQIVAWDAFTTNPQGPNEILPPTENGGTETKTTVKSYGRGENGADTDFDGVPDGWELYVMSGPKKDGKFLFAHPYAGFATGLSQGEEMPESYFSPFLAFAKGTETSNQIYLGGQPNDDGLNEFKEFEGTDSIAYYAVAEKEGYKPYSTTVVHPATEPWKWFNKFFPTDPWSIDTDGDSLSDSAEKGAFAYGEPADDGKLWSIPGGGLNPCSMDTDLDGLPDPWENQYKGSTVYAGENPKPFYVKDANGGEVGNPLEGLTDGMDGTVPDAYNVVNGSSGSAGAKTTWTVIMSDGRRWSGHVNRDYDRDGLENWQEYLTGAMRCWRYDDPYSPWTAIPKEMYYTYDPEHDAWAWDPKDTALGCDRNDPGEFWYKTLVDRTSGIYNPHLVVDSVCGDYFSRVTNVWDSAYLDLKLSGGKKDGAWYFLYDRVGPDLLKNSWVGTAAAPKRLFDVLGQPSSPPAPTKYMGCSPLEYDSDGDGMDDYYELFHGLNPLLGQSGVAAYGGPCDLVCDAWGFGRSAESPATEGGFEAWGDKATANFWQRYPTLGLPNGGRSRSQVPGGYDFEVFPWLNGLQMADPDGDDMRNLDEALMPRLADAAWHHTDPTPLWMTDSSYADSLVRRFFCLPTRFEKIPKPDTFFEYKGVKYFFRDLPVGWGEDPTTKKTVLGQFVPDFWDLSKKDAYNWICSFEENEGFDTDHDGIGDTEEASSRVRAATDLQDFDSPRRRQAMYFQGAEWPSVLQTMPEETERYPVGGEGYPDDSSFRNYTVECWVNPDAPADGKFPDMTILERAIWTGLSNPGDEEFMRKNFQLGIRNNKWYTKYDPDGTLKNTVVEVLSAGDATTGWHHLAATYDGVQLVLYVDGTAQTPMPSSLAPERGTSALALRRDWSAGLQPGDYWFDNEYTYKAIIVGARAKGRLDLPKAVRETGYTTLDLSTGVDFSRYDGFFKGYVDEISVWDGARSDDDIFADYSKRVRLDRTAAIENRSEFYKKWSVGGRRYAADLSGTSATLVPELRYHWSFDALFGAENPEQIAIEPHGFSAAGKPILSRPEGYVVDWWRKVVGDPSASIYAGNLNWVPWIHNTVAHLPRFDTTTLDSMFWSENFCGATNGTYVFPRTAEPVSRWTQFVYNGAGNASRYWTTGSRHHLVFEQGWSPSNTTTLVSQFNFTGRHLNQVGEDLLPLGGAFVKYVDKMWDDQGASSMWEQTGEDSTANGLPDWWEEYADQNYRPEGMPAGTEIDWNTEVERDGRRMTAGEAYLRDLAAGMYVDSDGIVHPTESDRASDIRTTPFEQTAKSDGYIPDWWKSLYKIDDDAPLNDFDNDGLNNYIEYVASELLPFRLVLNPRMSRTDTATLDYFRKVGRLYLGEMLTDHDQMEDHWERSLGDESVASVSVWDALKDAEDDGWVNFDESRYNGYSMSTLAQLVSHAMGDNEVLDAPVPSIKLKVRYNGQHFKAASSAADGQQGGGTQQTDDKSVSSMPNLIVRTFTDDTDAADAEFTVQPGVTVKREVYLGNWENRVVRGTMAPGNVDIGTLDIKFAQVPQSDLYSWTDESGTHLARPYSEFKEALDKNPDIIQNIQNFEWLELYAPANEYTRSDRAVTVTRDKLTQTGTIAVYGERVGTVNLTTGEFEFDMAAMNNLRVNYTYDGGKGPAAAWSYQEAIFKITYEAKVPSLQSDCLQVTLYKADKKFVKGGRNTIMAFFDLGGTVGEWDPGEPFGVVNDVDIGWAGRTVELELTDTSAITPRIALWSDLSDRENLWGAAESSNRVVVTTPTASRTRVRVVRAAIDGQPVDKIGVEPRVVLDRTFDQDRRTFLQEGDFLANGEMDIDWSAFLADLSNIDQQEYMLTNVTYRVVIGDGSMAFEQTAGDKEDTNTVITALGTMIERRFEMARTAPTPTPDGCIFNRAQPTFAWKLDKEDTTYAARFGTTYTAFKVVVKDGATTVYSSPVTRMPPCDSAGIYRWTAPLYAGEPSPSNPNVIFKNLSNYTWQVYVYNAKFKRDANPSPATTFRMNVTDLDASSSALAVRVCYTGPANELLDRVRVQAFESPDFTGVPVSETTLRYVDIRDSLSPEGSDANAKLIGLPVGSYFLRAYIDTNMNGVRDDWESWGYLNERDLASKPGIFNPIALAAALKPSETNVRKIFIEDCDTDGDWFPDVWEAEQNGGVFEAFKTGEGQGPLSGDAELIGVNPELSANLNISEFPMLEALSSKYGLALISGIPPTRIRTIQNSDGTLGIQVDNTVEVVKVTALDFDKDGNIQISIAAATTTGELDESLAALYNLALSGEMDVTCVVYRKTKLSDKNWAEVGRQKVRVGGAESTTITVAKPVADNAGFYQVKILE